MEASWCIHFYNGAPRNGEERGERGGSIKKNRGRGIRFGGRIRVTGFVGFSPWNRDTVQLPVSVTRRGNFLSRGERFRGKSEGGSEEAAGRRFRSSERMKSTESRRGIRGAAGVAAPLARDIKVYYMSREGRSIAGWVPANSPVALSRVCTSTGWPIIGGLLEGEIKFNAPRRSIIYRVSRGEMAHFF